MSYPTLIIVAVCAYLLGSIPFGYILVRLFQGIDVRSIGSGNTGATNVARTGGKKVAIATLVLDIFKGWLTVFLVLHLPFIPSSGPVQLHALGTFAALLAVIGHMFPLWLGFKGGKGVATGFGVFLGLAPVAALIAITVFFVMVALTRYVSLGSILGSAALPLALCWLYRDTFHAAALAMSAATALLIIARHRQNIGRLLAGTESRLGARKA
jgi:glycerol-3-phosphate acyltransferase PlsY